MKRGRNIISIDIEAFDDGFPSLGMSWGKSGASSHRVFTSAREVASVFGLHKSAKPAMAFFAGVEYVHASKAARLLAKHRARETKWLRFTYHASTRDKKRERREARRHAKAIAQTLPERAAVWRKRARNG